MNLPHLGTAGELIIPFDAPRKYRWWQLPKGLTLEDEEGREALHGAFAEAWSCAMFEPATNSVASTPDDPTAKYHGGDVNSMAAWAASWHGLGRVKERAAAFIHHAGPYDYSTGLGGAASWEFEKAVPLDEGGKNQTATPRFSEVVQQGLAIRLCGVYRIHPDSGLKTHVQVSPHWWRVMGEPPRCALRGTCPRCSEA